MSTAIQSPSRRRFPHLSSPKVVANIIASKRHASTTELKATTTAPEQRRTVSTPMVTDKSGTDSDAEGEPSPTVKTAPASHKLTFSHAASIFVRMRRVQKKVKAHHIDSNSGDDLITDSSLLNANGDPDVTKKLARLELQDVYVCSDGVDVSKLLRASRAALLERASPLHANVLVDEQWESSICGPKHRNDGSFRVHIRYAATAATSSKRDSRQPVALDKSSGVPGLMTIVQRDTVGLNVIEYYEGAQS